MRTAKSTVSTILALGLLAGLPGASVAQDGDAASVDVTWPELTTDLAYGQDDSFQQVLHVFAPEPRSTPRPAVVFFHGGGLVMGTPLQDLVQAQAMAEMGYVTFMAGYRLFKDNTGENPWPVQLEDAQLAIRWIRTHAQEFNVDPGRICAVGHSSGGQLASLLGMMDAPGALDGGTTDVSTRVDCVVTVSGPVDMLVPQGSQFMRNVHRELLGGTVEEVPEAWRAASPAHHVDDTTVPFLVIHGSLDRDAPLEGSVNLAGALGEAGVEYVFAQIPADHMGAWSSEATGRLMEAFLAYQLHPDA